MPNGAKLSLSVVDIDENTIKYSDFGVTNGIGVYSNLKGKATVSIPLDEKFTGAEHVYVYVSDALTPIESEINNGYIVFDVNDITQLIAISTEKWTENATPAKGNMVNVTSTTLEDNGVTVTGMLPIGATLTTEKFDNDSNSFELSIIVKNAKGEVIAFNKENMSAQATFVLDEQYANADRLYVYAVSKKNQRIVYTNATYTPVKFFVTADDKININLNSFGTYVISTVELDENGNYVNMSEIDIAKTSLESYINKLEVNESDYTAESYAAYIKAIENAKNVIANDNATIDEVNTAKTAINTAISNLVKVDDTTSDNSTSDTSDDTTSDDNTSDDNNTGDVTNSDSTSDIIPGDSGSNVTSDPIENNPNDASNPDTGLVTTPIGITAAFSTIASIVGVIFSKKRK